MGITDINQKGVFGMPFSYLNSVDLDKRVYKELFYDKEKKLDGSIKTNFYPFKVTVGVPRMVENRMKKVLSGLGQAVMNKEDPKEKLEKIRKEIETNGERLEKGLRTFFFNADTKGAYKNVINAMALSAFSHLPNASEAIKDLTSLASRGFSSFYLLGTNETNISESVNNEVGDSMLKQVLDKGSAVSREISFSLGGGGGETGLFLHGLAGYVSAMDFPGAETIGSTLNTAITSAGKAASDILGDSMVKIITQGSQLIFPRVWQSSAFTKSVQIQCRFYSPFGHPDAIRKYVINPALVILGFSIPIQDSASTYRYPFLVQLDNPDANATRMGIVSEISIKRGGKYDAWSGNGMFRGLDITLTITDLMGVITAVDNFDTLEYAYESRDFFRNFAGGSLVSHEELTAVLSDNLGSTLNKYNIGAKASNEAKTRIKVLQQNFREIFEKD
jgi:hypothetical protein